MTLDDLETPALVVDLDRVDANIARLAGYCQAHSLGLRPHIKTHKNLDLARMQIAAGANGIACQKVGEAEVMAAAGPADILIPFTIVGAAKIGRLLRLARETRVLSTVDSDVAARGLADAATAQGQTLDLLVEMDTGLHRAGVAGPKAAVKLARLIAGLRGARFAGLLIYPSTPACVEPLTRTLELLAADGIPVPVVSGGGTPNALSSHQVPGLTEIRAGTYVFNDRNTVASGFCSLDECAARVLATVVSVPAADRAVLDAGSKAVSADNCRSPELGFAHVCEHPAARLVRMSEEHGVLDTTDLERPLRVGDRVSLIPNHICTTLNLYDRFSVCRDGGMAGEWLVHARGRCQ